MANGRNEEEESLATRVGRAVGGTARAAGERISSAARGAIDLGERARQATIGGVSRGIEAVAEPLGDVASGFTAGLGGAAPGAQEFIPAPRFPVRAAQGAPAPQMAEPRTAGALPISPAQGARAASGMQGFMFDPTPLVGRGQMPRRDVATQAQPAIDVPPDRPAAAPPPGAPERIADRTEETARDVERATGETATATEPAALTGPEIQPGTTPREERLQRVAARQGVQATVGRQGEAEFFQGQPTSDRRGFGGQPIPATLGTFIPGADDPLFGARLQAAARGDYRAVLDSFLNPEGFGEQQRIRDLESQATAPVSLDQSYGSFLQAAARRNFAQRRLLAAEEGAREERAEERRGARQERLERIRQTGQTERGRERGEEARELLERRGAIDLERGRELEGVRGERRMEEIETQARLRGEEAERGREFQREEARTRGRAEAAERRRKQREAGMEEQQRLRREIITGELERSPGAPVEEVTGRAAETIRSLQEQIPPAGFPSDAQMFRKPDGTMSWAVRRGGQVIEVFEDGL